MHVQSVNIVLPPIFMFLILAWLIALPLGGMVGLVLGIPISILNSLILGVISSIWFVPVKNIPLYRWIVRITFSVVGSLCIILILQMNPQYSSYVDDPRFMYVFSICIMLAYAWWYTPKFVLWYLAFIGSNSQIELPLVTPDT